MPRLVAVLVGALLGIAFLHNPHSAARVGGPVVGPHFERRAGLTFDPAVDPASRALIEQSLAAARPEARRLIDDVAGLCEVIVAAPPREHALGTTQRLPDGHYVLILNLGRTLRETGQRGVVRMVLHEFGHVVDGELVDDRLAAQLDAGIPPQVGAPVSPPERFAETFAKWAMGNDLGATIYSGYAVPPPARGFDAWASPLVSLPVAHH